MYIESIRERERDRRLQKKKEKKRSRGRKNGVIERKKEAHIRTKLVYPLTFCPPAELNDPFGVPFGCRQPFCIGIGVALFVVGGDGSIVVLLLLSSIIG
jgi:hypothetical protein